MKKTLLVSIILLFAAGAIFFFFQKERGKFISPIGKQVSKIKEKPLDKYTFEFLRKQKFTPSKITFDRILKDEKDFSSSLFYFNVEVPPGNGTFKKVSGLANIPQEDGIYPVIVMFRGWADREKYKTGDGTRRGGEFFAQNDFITLAPDFLGYGESDPASEKPMEERFQTYLTALTLLVSVGGLNKTLGEVETVFLKINPEKIGIWGHSNGGQVALSVLEITGQKYPTALWAPVSKPFPYSVLYYTDEFEDRGKFLRRVIADFERDYDVEKYSLTNFFDWIEAPIQLHQGGGDEAVPQKWSDELNEKLEELDKDITYFTYPGDDHNFARSNWSTVVSRNISFYQKYFSAQ